MTRTRWAVACAAAVLPLTSFSQAPRNAAAPPKPRLEPLAETSLLMDGLARANFRGLGRLLKDKPTDVNTWAFARGQALLVAETGNLLMLRPPRNQGQEAWMARAAELRDAGGRLSRVLAARDYARSRAGMAEVANACNRCHQTFRVNVEVVPFADEAD